MNDLIDAPVDELTVQPATNPLLLLQAAVERGMDPGQLKALVDLHESWRAARAKEAFGTAMNACQAEIPTIVRDAENTQTRSRYARQETIIHQIKPIYVNHGFSLSFSEDDAAQPTMKRHVCLIRHNAGHSERHWVDLPADGIGPKGNPIGGMNAVQGCISTGSYAQRVLTCRLFNITIADTDLDGNVPPPRHPNPDPNQNAPQERPRGKRAEPPQVSEAQLNHVKQNYLIHHKEPDGNVDRMRENFRVWAREATGRTEQFDPTKAAQWCDGDYIAACKALRCPTLEDIS